MYEPNINSTFDRFHYRQLLQIFLLLTISFQVNSVCISQPISISNATSCTDNTCLSLQFATATTILEPLAEFCLSYEDPTNSTNKQVYKCGIDSADVSFPPNNVYFTDDFFLSGNVRMDCAVHIWQDPNNCPCSAPSTILPNIQFCIEKSVAADCLFARVSDTCANAVYQGRPRYRVEELTTPVNSIAMTCTSTKTNSTMTGVFTGDALIMNNDEFNVSSVIIDISYTKPGDFRVTDTINGKSYYLSSSVCNRVDESDPHKFGAIKFIDGVYTLTNRVKRATTYTVTSVSNKSFYFENPTPFLYDLVNRPSARDLTSDLPYLSKGTAWFNSDLSLNYIGRDLDGFLIMGPRTVPWPVDLVFQAPLSGINDFRDPDSTLTPYWNASCIVEVLLPYLVPTGAVVTNSMFAIATCPGVRYGGMVSMGSGSINTTGISTGTGYQNQQFNCRLFANPSTMAVCNLGLAGFNATFATTSYQYTRSEVYDNPSYPVSGGRLLTTLATKQFPLYFQDTSVIPTISSVTFTGGDIHVEAFANKAAPCIIQFTPVVLASSSIDLKSFRQDFAYSFPNLDFDEDLNVIIACGAKSANFTQRITNQIKKNYDFQEQLSYNNWAGVPWYTNLLKIVPLAAGSVGVLVVLKMVYSRFMSPKKMIRTRSFKVL